MFGRCINSNYALDTLTLTCSRLCAPKSPNLKFRDSAPLRKMAFISIPVSAGGFAIIATLIVAGGLPGIEAAPASAPAFFSLGQYHLGSVDGNNFYIVLERTNNGFLSLRNLTWEEADDYCRHFSTRLPTLEQESHRQFLQEQLGPNVVGSRGFWLRNREDDLCQGANLTTEELQIGWDACSGLARVVFCEGDA